MRSPTSNLVVLKLRPQFTANDYVYDTEANKVAVHGITTADAPFGPFVNECSIFFEFDKSGQKITRMQEMVDSAVVAGAMAKLNELRGSNVKDESTK